VREENDGEMVNDERLLLTGWLSGCELKSQGRVYTEGEHWVPPPQGF